MQDSYISLKDQTFLNGASSNASILVEFGEFSELSPSDDEFAPLYEESVELGPFDDEVRAG